MSDTSLAFNFLKGRDTATPHMKKVGSEATAMGAKLKVASVVSVAATASMVAGWAMLAAQGVAAVAAITPLLGLVAAVPALTIAAAGGIGVLIMATSGLGAAMKQTAGGAGNAGQAIAAAERRVESAQRSAASAQLDLNAARESAAERLVELSRLLAHAALDERAATLAVADAQERLRAARRSGDRSEFQHAQLGYEEAVLSLEDVKVRTQELAEEEQKRSAAGVEGSDEVQSALQRQADAMRNLADAQSALKAAGQGSGGVSAAAEAYAKLSQAGKDLVDVLKAIGPQWRGVQQAVQQSVFAGVAGDIKMLSGTYLPVMSKQLPEIGRGWNIAFRDTAALMNTAGFVEDVNTTLGHTATFWQRIGASAAPFLNGFRQFMVVGSTFLPGIGSWIERSANAFERWATAARESGRAQTWMQNGLTVLSQLWEVLKNLGGSIVAIFRAGDAGPGWLPGLIEGTQKLQDFLESPAGQGQIAAVFALLRDISLQLWAALTNIGPALLSAFAPGGPAADTMSVFAGVIGLVAAHLDTLIQYLPVLLGLFVLYKTIQSGAIVVDAIRIPLLVAQVIAQFALARAINGSTLATGTATTAQWLLNIAMWAFPVLLIVAGIALIIAGFVMLWKNSEGFRNFWIGLWEAIKAGFWIAVNWIVGKVVWLIETVAGIKAKVDAVVHGMWDGLVSTFKGAINALLSIWNRVDFGINIAVPTWVPGIGGAKFSVPDLFPDIPLLAKGGRLATAGSVVVGDAGPELLDLPQGATVTPLSRAGGGKQEVTVRFEFTGADQEFVKMFRKVVKVYGGGNVQVMAS